MSDDRAHGVTPGLRRDYAQRTAGHQAAFVLPHLRPGMSLLDIGCGPGSITLGLAIGRRLPAILRAAGFVNLAKSVSADTKGTPDQVREHAAITVKLLDGPLGRAAVTGGWADEATIADLKDAILRWSEHPDAFFANVHVEVIGFKPA